MNVTVDLSALGKTKWYEYAVRFVFGGIVTVLAGLIAKNFGPGLGGLFLAFPAIFPAGATLIQKHEKQKKEQAGINGTQRGRTAAGVDAAAGARAGVALRAGVFLAGVRVRVPVDAVRAGVRAWLVADWVAAGSRARILPASSTRLIEAATTRPSTHSGMRCAETGLSP